MEKREGNSSVRLDKYEMKFGESRNWEPEVNLSPHIFSNLWAEGVSLKYLNVMEERLE